MVFTPRPTSPLKTCNCDIYIYIQFKKYGQAKDKTFAKLSSTQIYAVAITITIRRNTLKVLR